MLNIFFIEPKEIISDSRTSRLCRRSMGDGITVPKCKNDTELYNNKNSFRRHIVHTKVRLTVWVNQTHG